MLCGAPQSAKHMEDDKQTATDATPEPWIDSHLEEVSLFILCRTTKQAGFSIESFTGT